MLESDKPDLVVAIGPLPMMNACVETTRPFGVKTMVSLNAIMVDGTGMCGSCRVTVGGEVKFACVDGPDFDGHQVDFKELMPRQKRFKRQETQANEDFDHVCQVEKQLFVDGKRNYKKFSALERRMQVKMPERDAHERAQNFKEVNLGYSMADALREAERCIQCAKPTCIAGCPVGIDIPTLHPPAAGARRRWRAGDDLRIEHLPLGLRPRLPAGDAVRGAVHSRPQQEDASWTVAIGRLERFVGDHAHPPKAVPPVIEHPLGKVAIVGSGPAGLAAAADLVRFGATSRSTRRCTCSAACCNTAFPASACRATSSTARSSA